MKKPVIAAHELCFGYDGTKVIDRLNLVIEEGDFMGLLGPNGGGKTTLIKILLGLLRPTCGTIELFGVPLERFKQRHLIGYVPQNVTNFDRRFPITVSEVVSMGCLRHSGMGWFPGETNCDMVEEAMQKVGVSKLADRLIGDLSGGQQQRAFIARALASSPRLLILDEPTAGIDLESNERFFSLLRDLNQGGITILMVSHDIGTITRNANKIACIAGSLLFHCPAPELTEERIRQVFAGQEILHHHHGRKEYDS
jgi:zinc transport system ATP-binding protein